MRLSVQIVDGAFGVPAANVEISVRRQAEAGWQQVATGRTDASGYVSGWQNLQLQNGIYQLEVDIDGYYTALGTIPLHPRAAVEFRVTDPTVDLHLPLLVTANSFQIYRGG